MTGIDSSRGLERAVLNGLIDPENRVFPELEYALIIWPFSSWNLVDFKRMGLTIQIRTIGPQ